MVVVASANDPKFRYALRRAWKGSNPDAVWERIERVTANDQRERYFEPPSQG